ncbi:P-type conjugative transfer protein TrbL [Vibrio parahaemolyticus]|nr:P-type conjugative transfer protein TrbL [Vibrio parahaemolyticus]
MKILHNFIFWGAISAFFCTSALAADIPQNNAINTIIINFRDQTITWEPIIYNLTLTLFWGLVTISFTWTFIQMVLKDGVGLVDVVAELTRRVLLIGFSIWMMQNAPDLARTLIKSFTEIGTRISGGSVGFSPSDVFELGMQVLSIIKDSMSITKPIDSFLYAICGLIILICFALIALEMTTLIVSGYIIVSGGIVAMGFLGSDWTQDNAINYFTAVLGIAFKMFIMQLIFVLGYGFIKTWGLAVASKTTDPEIFSLIGSTVVFAGLMREIPQIASSLASGRFTMAGGGIQASLKNIGSAAAGAALLGGAAAFAGAQQLMSSAKGSDNDSPEPSGHDEATANARTFDTGQGDTTNYMPPEFQQAAAASSATHAESASANAPESEQFDQTHSQSMDTGQGDTGQAFAEQARSAEPSSSGQSEGASSDAPHSASSHSETGANLETGAPQESATSEPSASSATANQAQSDSATQSPTPSDTPKTPTRSQKALSTMASGAKGLAIGSAKVTGKVAHAGLHAMATRTAFGAMLAEGAKKLGEKPVDIDTASMEEISRQLNASVTPPTPPSHINDPHFEDYLSPDKSDAKEEKQDRESEEKPTQE